MRVQFFMSTSIKYVNQTRLKYIEVIVHTISALLYPIRGLVPPGYIRVIVVY